MLKKKEPNDYRSMIAVGQLSLIFGILGPRIFKLLIPSQASYSAFFMGFIDGFCMVLIVVSIIFHIRGTLMYKKCEVRESGRRHY